ncbi:hypothetical protein SAMN04488038_101261 [Solimonas aquatica]|uniref:Uncharacterized protein n=1 Tax=Solimonas aquatica TaxID=489703 RepID=A0A1H9A5G7_9GAMM|nr:DUF1302 family protein [Solimonas aquatica]SEP71238.1 hypothetical protein SAMN04488038_101261 [Solimonas aquatica]
MNEKSLRGVGGLADVRETGRGRTVSAERGRYAALALVSSMAAVAPQIAHAGFDLFGLEIQGFIRAETAFNLTDNGNPNNQNGNVFNKQTISRDAYLPPALTTTILIPGANLPELITWRDVPFPGFQNNEVRRGDEVRSSHTLINYDVLRLEAETRYEFSENLTLNARVRALYDADLYKDFDYDSLNGIHGGMDPAEPKAYHGKPYNLGNPVPGGRNPNPLEWSGRNYFVDIPTFTLGYSKGPLNLRVGNQSIAWGQALFFRTFDTPEGLDLRRHLFVDRALEEFGDERNSSLAVRLSYQLPGDILLDSYIAKFQPSILPATNSVYNVVPAQFTIHDMFFEGGFDQKYSYGVRLKADYGDWGWQAMAARRWNPDGVFRWTESKVERPFYGQGIGQLVNTLYAVTPDPTCANAAGENNAATAFTHIGLSNEPGGVYSAAEYFYYAADARLDGVEALNHLLTDVSSCANSLGASPVDKGDYVAAYHEVDTFMIAAGDSLRGHIAREYFQENVFGLGASYVTASEIPFFDGMILNLETSYTPNRTFTDVGLASSFDRRDEWVTSLVADKWYRYTDAFPAALIIGQIMYRTTSDLVGRLLDGYGGTQQKTPGGVNGVTYVVLGGQQPFPNRIFEAEFATLIDVRGGAFAQLGLRWNPGDGWHVEGFYNGTSGKMWGDNPNKNLIGSVDFIDEFTLRIGKEF